MSVSSNISTTAVHFYNQGLTEFSMEEENKHLCSYCGKSYYSRKSMWVHMKKHKPDLVKCEMCQKTFLHKGPLVVHILSVHVILVFLKKEKEVQIGRSHSLSK